MTPAEGVILFLAGMLGGGLNSVAGGGSFVAFPALVTVGHLPSIEANATNTVSLWPGSVASAAAYRSELEAQRSTLITLSVISLIGGLAGSIVLIRTRPATFDQLLPYLLLLATLLFTFGGAITRRLRLGRHDPNSAIRTSSPGVALLQLVIAFYGGFFGGGIGILMLATLALMGMEDIHTMNALKTLLGSLINGISVVVFVFAGKVYWLHAGVMVAGAVLGGYYGAVLAKRIQPTHIRAFVIATGFTMTALFFYRAYSPKRPAGPRAAPRSTVLRAHPVRPEVG